MTTPLEAPTLAVELTSLCNQRCPHCYNAFDHTNTSIQAFPPDDLLRILGSALDEVPFAGIILCGGEPFAYEGLFRVLELCAARKVPAYIASNGTLITDEAAAQVAAFPSTVVQIPLGGPNAEVHESSVGVRGAWGRALRGIERLRSHGVVVDGCIVITSKNAHLVGLTLDRMVELGMTSVRLARLLAGGAAARHLELLPTRSELMEAFRQASDTRFRDMHLRVGGPIPPCVVNPTEFPTLEFTWCSVGRPTQEFALGTDGYLRCCVIAEGRLGDVREHSVADLVRSPEVTTFRSRAPEFCQGCRALPQCLGGCGAAGMAATGAANGLDPLVLQHVDAEFARRVLAARAEA